MAYSEGSLLQIADLLKRFDQPSHPIRVLELGAQELNQDVSVSAVLRFIYALNPNFAEPGVVVRLLPGCFVAPLYEAANVSYLCIDLFETKNVLQLDLNRDDLPFEHRGSFDLVTNLGTTEHIFNQAHAFEVIHEAAKVGGIMLHLVPSNGLFNHGLFKYEPKLFMYLAHVNHYEVLAWTIVAGAPDYMPVNSFIPGSSHWAGRDLGQSLLIVALRKCKDTSFVQPTDMDLRYVSADFPASLRSAASPSTPVKSEASATEVSGWQLRALEAAASIDKVGVRLAEVIARVEKWGGSLGLAADPYALALCLQYRNAEDLLDRLADTGKDLQRSILDELVIMAATHLPIEPNGCSVDLGRAFLGTGWGAAGRDVHAGKERHFRTIGPEGRASVFLKLSNDCDYQIKTLFFDAKPGDAVYRLQLHPTTENAVENIDGNLWHRALVSRQAIDERNGVVELRFIAGLGDKIILQELILEPFGRIG